MLFLLTLLCNLRNQFKFSDTTSNRFSSSLSDCMFCSFRFYALVYRSFFFFFFLTRSLFVRRFCLTVISNNLISHLKLSIDSYLKNPTRSIHATNLILMGTPHHLTAIILDTIIFHATTATMLEGSQESSTQQTFITSEKWTAKSYLRITTSFAVKWQPDTLFANKHKST